MGTNADQLSHVKYVLPLTNGSDVKSYLRGVDEPVVRNADHVTRSQPDIADTIDEFLNFATLTPS